MRTAKTIWDIYRISGQHKKLAFGPYEEYTDAQEAAIVLNKLIGEYPRTKVTFAVSQCRHQLVSGINHYNTFISPVFAWERTKLRQELFG